MNDINECSQNGRGRVLLSGRSKYDCKRVTQKDLTLKNPASWTSSWLQCNYITVTNVCIISDVNNNRDGLDFDCSTNI
jgi:polygalacturonase